MTTTTATQLQTVARLWPDLTDALGTPTTVAGFGLGLRGYLATIEQHDAEQVEFDRWQAAAMRALERSPQQLGARPIPISLRVHDTMRTVEAALHETADQIAAASQREPMRPAPANWPTGDRIRRNQLAAADARDPQRWQLTGTRPGAVRAALWLSARAEGRRWPGRPLDDAQQQHIARVATEALRRVETTLDLAEQRRELAAEHPCQCGGTIEVYGGAGAHPVARCKGCGAIWSERGVVAA